MFATSSLGATADHMVNPTFTNLEAAYQLHFYLCMKTRSLRPLFAEQEVADTLVQICQDVCLRQDYHLLDRQVSPDHLRVLLSLRPEQAVSGAVKMLKGNIARQLGLRIPGVAPWLGSGYFARSCGRVDMDTVKAYVDDQVAHHGYRGSWTKALTYNNAAFTSPAFHMRHCLSILNYHLVLVTKGRTAVFDETIAPNLFNYIIVIGAKHGFVPERMSILPDHLHLVLEAMPGKCIEEIARALMNNSAYWMGRRYWGVLKQTDAWQVWQPSFYAGTVGEYTTAQVRRFLEQ
jgi:putative transposase